MKWEIAVARSTLACVFVAWAYGTAIGGDAPHRAALSNDPSSRLISGNHVRTLVVDDLKRTAIIHVPKRIDPDKPTPVVLALHGAAMTGSIMAAFCGLNETADDKGFVVVYPNGTGPGRLLTWNAGGFSQGVGSRVDDVKFLGQLLDDVGTVVNVDPKRVYACGLSNGGMMSYRLAAELSNRIAAIAAVAGTMAAINAQPQRPVSVIHFHGTQDTLVPYDMDGGKSPFWLKLKSVDATVQTWRKLDGCDGARGVSDILSQEGDELKVTRQTYGPGTDGSEVVLVTIEGGGHTWPGQEPPFLFLGKSAMKISANELIWEFFEKHPMK